MVRLTSTSHCFSLKNDWNVHFYKKNYLHFIKNCLGPTYKKPKPRKSAFIKNSSFEINRDSCLTQSLLTSLIKGEWNNCEKCFLQYCNNTVFASLFSNIRRADKNKKIIDTIIKRAFFLCSFLLRMKLVHANIRQKIRGYNHRVKFFASIINISNINNTMSN